MAVRRNILQFGTGTILAALLLVGTIYLGIPPSTGAFDLLETDGDDNPGSHQILLGWSFHDLPIVWAITNAPPPDGINHEDFRSAVESSFDTWEDVPSSYLHFQVADESKGALGGYVELTDPHDPDSFSPIRQSTGNDPLSGLPRSGPPSDDGKLNVVSSVHHGWTSEFGYSGDALAVTVYAFNSLSRRIVGADIFLNAQSYPWSTDGDDDAYDLQNVLTHEVGHMIGLGHPDPELRESSTMYFQAGLGETSKRELDQDDINGITYLYPEAGAEIVQPDRNTKGLKFQSSSPIDDGPRQGGGACSIARSSSSSSNPWAPLIALLPLLVPFLFRSQRAGRTNGRGLTTLLMIALIGLVFPPPGRATLVIRRNIMELTLRSTSVVHATVHEVTPTWVGGRIMRRVRASVHEAVKGPSNGEIEFWLPGGVIGDVGMGVVGTPSFDPGEEAVIFLEGPRSQVVTGMAQGKFGVLREDDRVVAVQDTRGLCLLDARPPAPGEAGGPATDWAARADIPPLAGLRAGDDDECAVSGCTGAHAHGSLLRVPLAELLDTIRHFAPPNED